MIAWSICFDSHVWTQKSDITRATYECFHLRMRSSVCLPKMWHNFSILFIAIPLSFKIFIFEFHMIAWCVSFDLHVWTQNSYITRPTYEHFDLCARSCKCLPQMWHNFGIFFISLPLNFKIFIFLHSYSSEF